MIIQARTLILNMTCLPGGSEPGFEPLCPRAALASPPIEETAKHELWQDFESGNRTLLATARFLPLNDFNHTEMQAFVLDCGGEGGILTALSATLVEIGYTR